MSSSLRDQLLAAGLGTKKQAQQIDQQQRQQKRREPTPPKRAPNADQQRASSNAQAQAAKAARDQELNRKRQEEAERRARWAQIKQLIEQHAVPRPESDEAFNFVDGGKVRRIYANAALQAQIIGGALVIARCEGRFHLVPPDVAARIKEREPRAIVALNQKADQPETPAEDDPYKDFVVPDDLKW
jgi:uncharacterized protein YaiL (DUF2058 family)